MTSTLHSAYLISTDQPLKAASFQQSSWVVVSLPVFLIVPSCLPMTSGHSVFYGPYSPHRRPSDKHWLYIHNLEPVLRAIDAVEVFSSAVVLCFWYHFLAHSPLLEP